MKIEPNDKFVERIMNYGCPTGGLVQPFVLQALESYADTVIEAKDEEIQSALVTAAAWRATAVWIKKQLDDRYATFRAAEVV